MSMSPKSRHQRGIMTSPPLCLKIQIVRSFSHKKHCLKKNHSILTFILLITKHYESKQIVSLKTPILDEITTKTCIK